ncbi:Metalloproteases (zincins), catalytic [Glarea lozoyensis ATCC 20868]|uniref:Metalloproteases (Zincins), catalytic n=1 Tax=Glarea lozoyensis (strain ATCC 20868 / MF5171) TaxID=1116229 RepID=S3DAU0_GLAL2|nr:Metalloproteases (zincins), catalytic [Glarea lozoyensis ATCC 20868]EPE35587.1 Metalloproteases (zincins), catalytic [Glarea lozoyensis ATCC 20868]
MTHMLVLMALFCLSCATAHPPVYTPAIAERQVPSNTYLRGFQQASDLFPRTLIQDRCSDKQKETLRTAWKGAKKLAEAQTSTVTGYDYDAVHRAWFGDDWNVKGDPEVERRTQIITDNMARLTKLFRGEVGDHDNFVFWCEDKYGNCEGEAWAASFEHTLEHGALYQSTVFCPEFFEEEDVLEEDVEMFGGHPDDETRIDHFQDTTAVTMLHEIYHYQFVVSDNPTLDIAEYGAGFDYQLAREKGTEETYLNANSYAMDALVIYLQQTFQSSTPALPPGY